MPSALSADKRRGDSTLLLLTPSAGDWTSRVIYVAIRTNLRGISREVCCAVLD